MFTQDCLAGQTALITGASSGLGAHFAKVLAQHGASVIVAARRIEKLDQIVNDIKDSGGEATAIALDVSDPESVTAAFAEIEQGKLPTILLNNAGVADIKRFLNLDEDSWQKVMSTNLDGVYRVARAFAAMLVKHELGGSIINTASIGGLRIGIGQAAYGTSKAAVIHLTRGMSQELASKGIRVNALCPGFFETEMNRAFFSSDEGQAYIKSTPARRTGRLEELNGPLLLLCSEAGSFINGVALPVDGSHSNQFQ